MLFSKRLAPAPPLALCLEATIQGQGPSFQAELIPVRSPLLRESYLVSYPPLTYMLKFSGFADLTSCLGVEVQIALDVKAPTAETATDGTGDALHVADRRLPPCVACDRGAKTL